MHTATQLKKRRIHSVVIDLQGKIDRGMAAEAFYAGLVDDLFDSSSYRSSSNTGGVTMRYSVPPSASRISWRMSR